MAKATAAAVTTTAIEPVATAETDSGANPRASVVTGDDGRARCAWSAADEDYRRYHDEEWGRPLRDDRALFEKLCLEGFQAGLSWLTILRRRPAFRADFHDFDIERVAAMTDADVERLLTDPAIIRHRGKIRAAIENARVTVRLDQSLSELLWSFAPSSAGRARPESLDEIVAVTPESTAMSAELRRRGYRFVGPTTMHALMQSAGMVDDHVRGCWRASAVGAEAA
jgi:DNA-3-methyladenine glycosylase I